MYLLNHCAFSAFSHNNLSLPNLLKISNLPRGAKSTVTMLFQRKTNKKKKKGEKVTPQQAQSKRKGFKFRRDGLVCGSGLNGSLTIPNGGRKSSLCRPMSCAAFFFFKKHRGGGKKEDDNHRHQTQGIQHLVRNFN